MSAKKNALGRGLGALLQSVDNPNEPANELEPKSSVTSAIDFVPISEIKANPFQPRKEFDETALTELAESIKSQGIITPITVRKTAKNQYQLIAGERRFRASQLAGLTEIPAYIRVATDTEMMEMALVENIQRENLNAMEIALSYQALIEDCKITQEKLSERVGKNRSTITNYLRLLKLPAEIQIALSSDKISMAHARTIVSIENVEDQLAILKKIIDEDLSVRQVEAFTKKLNTPVKKSASKKESLPVKHSLAHSELSERLNTAIAIKRSRKGKGSITIEFNNDSDFERIVKLLS